ncbi:MAG: hypothetical protein M0C28_19160 [Candidatus Moduliflexus flocculans]|nr:hypothetical protein [Candidatus Moduliflexus flocculans]
MIAGLGQYQQQEFEFDAGAEITARILDKLLAYRHDDVVYNLNIPFPNCGEIAVTALGSKRYTPDIIERDRSPRPQVLLDRDRDAELPAASEGSDVWAVQNDYISLSVIKYDLNSPGRNGIAWPRHSSGFTP